VYGSLILSFSDIFVAANPTRAFPPLRNGTDSPVERRAGDFWLRIMPLGASITAGDFNPPGDDRGNGYRKFLRDKLRADGWRFNMVGSFQRGTMNDKVLKRDSRLSSGD
jgi:hypothetical protein